jgi:hypothetical protein
MIGSVGWASIPPSREIKLNRFTIKIKISL